MSSGIDAVVFVLSLIATLYAAAVFADRLDHLGARLGLPESVLGMVTAAGADAPELASAIAALATGAKGVGLGVVIGSNVFNLAAMLGVSALVAGAVTLRREALALEGGVALGVTGAVCLFGFGVVPAWTALVLALAILVPYAIAIARAERGSPVLGEPHRRRPPHGRALWVPLATIPPALAVIVLGSIAMVHTALQLADRAGLPRVLVGTLLLAVLTSLPNAYTGVRLGRARRGSALVSETMNSNTINLVGGVVVPALFVGFGSHFSGLETAGAAWLLAATGLSLVLLARPGGLRRTGGGLLLASWVGFAAVQGIFG
jgi:cation:H+ antiporter